jgi:protein-S-isoprenylcysteine O-methyltransferase Ste14
MGDWLYERRRQRRRRARLARCIGIPLLTLLFLVSLMLAPPYFLDARRDGDIVSWVAFVLSSAAALLSMWWLVALWLTYSSRGEREVDVVAPSKRRTVRSRSRAPRWQGRSSTASQ